MTDEFKKLSAADQTAVRRAAETLIMETSASREALINGTIEKIENVLAKHPDEVARAKKYDQSLKPREKEALDFVLQHAANPKEVEGTPAAQRVNETLAPFKSQYIPDLLVLKEVIIETGGTLPAKLDGIVATPSIKSGAGKGRN